MHNLIIQYPIGLQYIQQRQKIYLATQHLSGFLTSKVFTFERKFYAQKSGIYLCFTGVISLSHHSIFYIGTGKKKMLAM